MKNAILFFATTITLLFGFQSSLFAQKTATWKGGTPGKPSEWFCATNWEEGRVPNEFSAVIIPDVSTSTFSDPILNGGEVEIQSLEVHSGASLKIGKNARLVSTWQNGESFVAWGGTIIRQGAQADSIDFANQ